jgi:hypothetical protein
LLVRDEKKKKIRDEVPVTIITQDDGTKVVSLTTMLSIVDASLEIVREAYSDYIK